MPDKQLYQFFQTQSDEIVHHLDLIRPKLPDNDKDLRILWNQLYFSWSVFDNHIFNTRKEN